MVGNSLAALLVADILKKRGYPVIKIDPRCDGGTVEAALAASEGPPPVILIGCNHPEYIDVRWPAGGVVIDPWRYIADQEGVTVLRLGEGAGKTCLTVQSGETITNHIRAI